jgi:uncharacterized protein YabE (DUF348 family)
MYFLMILRLRKSTTIITIVLAMLGLVGVFVGSLVSRPALASNESGRLITVHDRGKDTVFLTQADTLKDAFKQAGIEVDSHDAVEPSMDEKLVANDYQVNIYRARPVTVIDGSTRLKVVTPYQTAAQIIADVGIQLYPEDTTTLTRSSDIVADGAGLELKINRATPMVLDLYGKQTDIRTQGKTIGEMLKEKGITLGAADRSSLPSSTPITSGMEVRIWREGKQTVAADEAVPFGVQQIEDADQLVGYKAIQTPGVEGKRSVTYEIEVKDGKEISRTEIASIVTQQPQTQVEVIGTKSNRMPYTGGGSKTEWLAASSIPQDSWGYADYIVGRESGWNPNSTNKSSGACGLAQALPCNKVPGNPYNPVDSLNWMNSYVGRYGGWQGAYNFWLAHNWY